MNYISFHSVPMFNRSKILVGRNKMNAKLKYMPILISADFKKIQTQAYSGVMISEIYILLTH